MSGILGQPFVSSVPARELDRRRAAMRAAMREQDLDCLVMQNSDQFLGGYVRYFLDIPAFMYATTVLFSAREGTAVIGHGAPSERVDSSSAGEIIHRVTLRCMPTFCFTATYAADATVKLIRGWSCKKIGIVNPGVFPTAFHAHLKEVLAGVEIVDATNLVDEIKAIKSPDEMVLIRQAVAIHDYLAMAMGSIFRPGRLESEVKNELKKLAGDLGCEGLNIALGADAKRPLFGPTHKGNRRIEPGDGMMCLIEVSGPGGYYGELARTWYLGEPSRALVDAWEVAVEAQKLVASMAKPGVHAQDLLDANNEFLVTKGYGPEERLFAHGQGYDMVERPGMVLGETMVLKEGMFLAIHPTAADSEAAAFVCDNFIVTAEGAQLLTKTPQQLITL